MYDVGARLTITRDDEDIIIDLWGSFYGESLEYWGTEDKNIKLSAEEAEDAKEALILSMWEGAR